MTTPSTAHATIAASTMSMRTSQIEIDGSIAPPNTVRIAEPDVRAHHEHVAVREVQELQDPVDHRVAERDQRIGAPERRRVDDRLEELVVVHGSCAGAYSATARE